MNQLNLWIWINEDDFLIAIICGLIFLSMRITHEALLESRSDYLYNSTEKEYTFFFIG